MSKINSFYTDKNNLSKIREVFHNQKIVSLQQFLEKEEYFKLVKYIEKVKLKKEFHPIHFSYCSSEFGNNKNNEFNMLLEDKELRIIIKELTGMEKVEAKLLSFGWKEYTIINDEFVESSGIDIIIDLTEGWDDKFGGCVTVIDGEGNSTKVPCTPNTLTILQRAEGEHKFIKYANHLCNGKKHLFILCQVV